MQELTLVPMSNSQVQSLIQYNKTQIKELQLEKQYLEYLIATKYWPYADPNDLGVISQKSYELLNKAKDDLRVIKKKMKMLAELQYSLKYSIR